GVVSPFFTMPSFVERLSGIQHVLDDSSYDLVLYNIAHPEQISRKLISLASQKRVDGLIILSLSFHEKDLQAFNPDLPLVVVDNDSIQHYPHNMIDNVAGGQLATNYLIERGHRAIGFLGDVRHDSFGFTSTYKRFQGFRMALAQAGLEYRDEWCKFGEYTEEIARQQALEILREPRRPTAIFAAIDTLAFGTLAAARDLGLRIPQDLAVIGFDDIKPASYVNLTTVRQPLFESGVWGAQKMLEWLTGKLDYRDWRVTLPLCIIERTTA
ncbi:MAG: substrate-binding domain-containing protein, partial [Chloroflexi bacterium]|nr:substrate-binding domain-containing protein [Chloroflexota bacterium]